MPDIYSQFSKQTNKTYSEIKSRTESRLILQKEKETSEAMKKIPSYLIGNVTKNQQMPHETLDQFILSRMKERPGKKLYFEKQPGPEERQKLLKDYLNQVD